MRQQMIETATLDVWADEARELRDENKRLRALIYRLHETALTYERDTGAPIEMIFGETNVYEAAQIATTIATLTCRVEEQSKLIDALRVALINMVDDGDRTDKAAAVELIRVTGPTPP